MVQSEGVGEENTDGERLDAEEGDGKKRWWQCCKNKDKKPPKLGWIMGVLVRSCT